MKIERAGMAQIGLGEGPVTDHEDQVLDHLDQGPAGERRKR